MLNLSKKERRSGTIVAMYLAYSGGNFHHKNKTDETPLDLIENPVLKQKMKTLFPSLCLLCEVNEPTVKFQPCGHTVTCKDCCLKIQRKTCPKCQQVIVEKSGFGTPKSENKEVQTPAYPSESKVLPTKCSKLEAKCLQVRVEKSKCEWQQVESSTLEEKHLLEVAEKLRRKWWQVGRILGIKSVQLEIIKHDNPGNTEVKGFQTLRKWFTTCDPEKRTLKTLRDALLEAECFEALECLPQTE